MMNAIVSMVEGNSYRVCANGIVSMPIPRLDHVVNLTVGDNVFCHFDNMALSSGVIIGKVVV